MGIAAFCTVVIVKQPSSDNTPYEKIGDEVRSLADEVSFDIPDSWEWVRFGNIVANYDNKRRPITKEQRKNEHGYYDYYGATGAIDRVDDYIFEGEYVEKEADTNSPWGDNLRASFVENCQDFCTIRLRRERNI